MDVRDENIFLEKVCDVCHKVRHVITLPPPSKRLKLVKVLNFVFSKRDYMLTHSFLTFNGIALE